MASKTASSEAKTAKATRTEGQPKDGGSDSATMANASSSADLAAATAEASEQIGESLGQLGEQVRHQAMMRLASGKDQAAEGLETAAGLLRGAGEQLRALDQPTFARYVDGTAQQFQGWSGTVRERDVSQLVEETERYARRQPALFLGGALALGFLGARFLVSSTPKSPASPAAPTPEFDVAPTAPQSYPSDYPGAMAELPPLPEAAYAETAMVGVDDYALDLGLAGETVDLGAPMLDDLPVMPERR